MARQAIDTGSSVGDPTAETIRSAFTKVNSMTTELYAGAITGPPWHNVLDYGALGNSSHNGATGYGHDDRAAIQAACDAAVASGGYGMVVLPAGKTYRITNTINVPPGVYFCGVGSLDGEGQNAPVAIVWDGATPGPMLQVASAFTSVAQNLFENICLTGGPSMASIPLNGIKFTSGGGNSTPDSGCGLKNVWVQNMDGDGLLIDHGIANFFIEGGRFDGIDTEYAININLTGAGSSCALEIYGNTNYVGGGASNGKGFLFLNGEGATADGSESLVNIRGLHTEINTDLVQTYSGGANPFDKRGIIRLGVTPARGNLQHRITVDGWFNGNSGGIASYSAFQITAASGTDADCADCCYIEAINCNAVNGGSTDAGTTDQFRLVGGRVPAARRYPYASARIAHFLWGQGKDTTGDGVRSFFHHRHGSLMTRGLTIQAETVADLTAFPQFAYCMAIVTDALVNTVGNTVASGGSAKALVMHNGTAWKIIAAL